MSVPFKMRKIRGIEKSEELILEAVQENLLPRTMRFIGFDFDCGRQTKSFERLLIVLQMLEYCQLFGLLSTHLSCCLREVLCNIILPKTSLLFRKDLIHKHGPLLTKKLFKYFTSDR